MYGLYPESAASFLPAIDPAVASPKVLFLGLFGGGLQLFGTTLLVGSVLYRLRFAPLTEAQAHAALNAEDFARYVGLGGDAVSAYVATMGQNPFTGSGLGASITTVSLLAFAASVTVFYVSRYFHVRLALFRRDGD